MSLTKVSYSMIKGAPVNILDYGAVGNGVTDDTDAFEDAIAAVATTGQTLYIPAGTYKLSRELSTTGHLNILGDGNKTVLDFSGSVSGSTGKALSVSGSLVPLSDITADLSKNAQSVVFPTAAHGLVPGDVFVIYNPTDYSYSGFRFYYRAGEWCEVSSVATTTVRLSNPLYATYVATSVDLYKMQSVSVSLRNFRIIGTTVESLITISLCKNPVIENVTGYLENNSIVSFDRCYQATAINLDLFNKGDGGDDYGLVITNSQDVEVIGGNFYSRRHGVTAGGADDVGSVPCRNLRINGATIKNDINSVIFAADFHGNVEDSVFENCRIYNGTTWQGKDNRLVNCVISDTYEYVGIYAAEIKGGYFTAENCTFLVSGDPSATSRGVIDIGGNSTAVSASTTERTTFVVKNCRVIAPQSTSSTSFVLFRNRGCTQYVNFDIDGVTAVTTGAAFNSVLNTANVSGTASSEYIIVDKLANFPAGTYIHNAGGSAYTNFPHRCQRQTGSQTLTATNGTAETVGTSTALNYYYPRTPAAFASSGGATAQTYIGNRPAVANLYQVTIDTVRPQITSGDGTNWSATAAVNVSWMTVIDEA